MDEFKNFDSLLSFSYFCVKENQLCNICNTGFWSCHVNSPWHAFERWWLIIVIRFDGIYQEFFMVLAAKRKIAECRITLHNWFVFCSAKLSRSLSSENLKSPQTPVYKFSKLNICILLSLPPLFFFWKQVAVIQFYFSYLDDTNHTKITFICEANLKLSLEYCSFCNIQFGKVMRSLCNFTTVTKNHQRIYIIDSLR